MLYTRLAQPLNSLPKNLQESIPTCRIIQLSAIKGVREFKVSWFSNRNNYQYKPGLRRTYVVSLKQSHRSRGVTEFLSLLNMRKALISLPSSSASIIYIDNLWILCTLQTSTQKSPFTVSSLETHYQAAWLNIFPVPATASLSSSGALTVHGRYYSLG